MTDAERSGAGGPQELTCPECGGVMYDTNPDSYCLECIHEGRV